MDLTNNDRGLEWCSGIRTWDILVNTRHCARSLDFGSSSYNALTINTPFENCFEDERYSPSQIHDTKQDIDEFWKHHCRHRILYPLRLEFSFFNNTKILKPKVGLRPNQIPN